VSAEDGTGVPDVRVLVRGSRAEAETDSDGRFSLTLPAGAWDLSLIRSGFSTLSLPGVTVTGDATTERRIEMVPAGRLMDGVRITAPRIEGNTASLLEERQNTSVVAEVLGAEQMKKAGDSDAASALRRVTGLSLLDGKYIVVRGMGERYNTALMNGLPLPSPEPNRRVVPLDLFQADMLDSIVVQKTSSPDMPAEFGGGVVQLRTRRFARRFTLGMSVSGTYLSGTTFTKRSRAAGGATDFLGADDGTRAMPEKLKEASDAEPLEESGMFTDGGYSPAELESFGESLTTPWSAEEQAVIPPAVNLGMNIGWGLEDADAGNAFGFLLAGTYGSSFQFTDDQERNILVPGADGPQTDHEYTVQNMNHNVSGGALFSVGGEFLEGTQELSASTILTRITDDNVRDFGGYNGDLDGTIRVQRLEWVERQLFIQQFEGHHTIPPLSNLRFDWVYAFGMGDRDEPDRREHRFDLEPDSEVWTLSDRPGGNERLYSATSEENHDVRADVTLPFLQWDGLEVKVKAGFAWHRKEKVTDTRRFKFMHKGPDSRGENLQRDIGDIFTDETIGPNGFQFEETTLATDNNTGYQEFPAAYGMIDIPLAPWVRVLAGARVERTNMRSETFKRFDASGQKEVAELNNTDVLPAFTATFTLMEGMLLRAGYGRAVNRPNLREISPSLQWEVTGGRPTFGNVDLQRALIDAVDVRWEWYFGRGEVASVAGFYKHLTNPVVTSIFPLADLAETWENGESGDLVGAELEWRKNFGFIAPPLQDLFFAGNIALIYSRIQAAPNAQRTNEIFPLTGQSPIVVNLQVGYDNPETGTVVTLLYNGFGRRLRVVGVQGLPDEYEQPLHSLDLIASQALPGGFKLSFKARNLLNYPSTRLVDDVVASRFRKGVSIGLGLSWGM
ncbi:MAG: TonB-dependent receptor, partial [Deltaproteobacteria bacterium]|nr:TonB-dependent receptor [Deltaproteobacteria bacterium]